MSEQVCIKVRFQGDRGWRFVSPGGGTNRLHIHAGLFDDRAQAQGFIGAAKPDNPTTDFKIVPAWPMGK